MRPKSPFDLSTAIGRIVLAAALAAMRLGFWMMDQRLDRVTMEGHARANDAETDAPGEAR